jgi:hypothetical protein
MAGNKKPQNRKNKNRTFLIVFILGLVIEQRVKQFFLFGHDVG